MPTIAIVIICVAGIAVSFKSVLVLGRHAPWTVAGWWLTMVYLVAEIAKVAAATTPPIHGEYIVLVLLAIAFVIAGVRDEPQAEPWWWPTHRGSRRADKRRMT